MAHIPRITLDTNCIINLFDRRSKTATSVSDLESLVRRGLSNKVEIKITTRAEIDLERDVDTARREEMLANLRLFEVIGTVARFDTSKWDSGDIHADEETMALARELQLLLFPTMKAGDTRFQNKLADIDHLIGHKINERDVFVTDDHKDILRKAETLKLSFGIIVMSPMECCSYLDNIETASKRNLLTTASDPRYRNKAITGMASFDYSNNNHIFALGEGFHLFETMWSKASDTSIHVCSDSKSVSAVAIAKGATAIHDIAAADKYDFSSRVRTVRLGQIAIWKNVNGLFAATKIMSIKDDGRNSDADEVSFEYVILPTGSSSFAR